MKNKKPIPSALAILLVLGIFTSAAAGTVHTDPIPISAGAWVHGSILGTSEYWYSIEVTEGTEYRVWWNDFDGTLDGDIRVFAFYVDGTAIFGGVSGVDMGWNTPQRFVADRTGRVLLRVIPWGSGSRGAFAITFSAATARPPFAITIDPDAAIPVATAQWTHGTIAGDSEVWFSFEVTAGTPYRVWWNDFDGTLNGDIRLSAFHADGTAIFGDPTGVDMGWNTPQWFMSDRTGTVFLRAVPHSRTARHGAFAVTYNTPNVRPPFAMQINPRDVSALTTATWEHGTIAGDSELWFSFEVSEGGQYRVWWNDFDGTLDGDIRVSAFYPDGTEIFGGIRGIDFGWNSPQAFTADRTSTVLLRAIPWGSGSRGAFAITYNTANVRPPFAMQIDPQNVTRLTTATWIEGTLDGDRDFWYSFDVTAGRTYRVWWNSVEGGTLDGDIDVFAFYDDGTEIFAEFEGWRDPQTFVADRTGTVLLRVIPYIRSGAFAIVYNTVATRPPFAFAMQINPRDVSALTTATWEHGTIAGDSELWFSFEASEGRQYRVWWNDFDGTLDGDVRVSAFYPDGAEIFGGTRGVDFGWSSPQAFTADRTGTVLLRVIPWGSRSQGAFAITYNTVNVRPPFAMQIDPQNVTELATATWIEGTLDGDRDFWYSFDVTAGERYHVWWNSVDGTLDGDIDVLAFYDDGTKIFAEWDGWRNPQTFVADRTGTVLLRVIPYTSSGSFAITYSTANARPPFAIQIDPQNITELATATWIGGTLDGDRDFWYSFYVTAGETYHVWWNSIEGTLDGDIDVLAFYDDGTEIFAEWDGWSHPQTFVADRTGIVLLRVIPYTPSGSFAIAYNTVAARPPFTM